MKLDFKYKGNRKYVQGPDIYTEVLRYVEKNYQEVENIKLSFHKIVNSSLEVECFKKNEVKFDYSEYAFLLEFSSNSGEYIVTGKPTTDEITERNPYDEEKIIAACLLNAGDKSITYKSRLPYQNLELIVAMNKALLTQILPEPGKWYFGKLYVHQDINKVDSDNIKVQLIRNIGSKITKSLISIDGEPVGEIYFTKVMP